MDPTTSIGLGLAVGAEYFGLKQESELWTLAVVYAKALFIEKAKAGFWLFFFGIFQLLSTKIV